MKYTCDHRNNFNKISNSTMLTMKCNLKFLSEGKNVNGLAGFELVTCR